MKSERFWAQIFHSRQVHVSLSSQRVAYRPDVMSLSQIVHKNIDLAEYQGDIEFIITEKCKLAAELVNGPVLVEDTSLW